MDRLLRPLFDLYVAQTRIINGLDLIRRVNKYTNDGYLQPTTLFCTFDITNLYTMLPQEESLRIVKKFLQAHNIEKVNNISVDTRYVTVPSQLKELEMFEKFSFMRTGDVDQLTSSELEMFTSSFHLNWKCSPVPFI